jgi:glycosyltransferase involved in cell wall biosynthesis
MAKKSILYVITKSVWGGAAKYVYDLAIHLSSESEVAVAAGGQGKFAQKIIKANIPYYQIKNFQRTINPFKDFFAFLEILGLIFKLKPEIIHVNSSKAGGLVGLVAWLYKLLTGRKLCLIFTAHGWAFAEDRPKWQITLIKVFSKLTCLFYDKVICVSEYDRQIAIDNKIVPANKLVAIHNGIDIKAISFLSREEAQKKLICKISPLVIGTIAEWTKNKGLFYLLEAVEILEASLPKFDVVLIGSGENPDKEKMYDFIKKYKLKNVHLIGWIDNAASYLKAFDIFVLPSLKEGLPYTILEAMAAQVPIVATRVGGVPEILFSRHSELAEGERRIPNEFGRNPSLPLRTPQDDVGILIPPKNSQELAEKIIYLINNPEIAQNLAQRAREKVEKEFSLEKMLQKTKRVYF